MALETPPASVCSMLQRAHHAVRHRIPELGQQATLRSLGGARLRALVDRYVPAWERNDVDAITAMLTEDATMCETACPGPGRRVGREPGRPRAGEVSVPGVIDRASKVDRACRSVSAGA